MTRSESLDQLLPALIAARATMPRIAKDQTANIESQRGRFSYAYADLSAVLEAVAPALCANGLAIVQSARVAEGAVITETTLFHSSGQWIAADPLGMPLTAGGAQAIGSAITYARRYAVLALLDLAAAGEDDDGASADDKARRNSGAAARTETAPPQAAAPRQAEPLAQVPADRKPKPEVVAEARERLERAARRGKAMLRAQLTSTPTVIRAAIGPNTIAELQRQAEQADHEVSPA